jgi:hypothetical protein
MQQERDAAVRARQSQQQRENRPEFNDLEQPPQMASRGNPPPATGMTNGNPAMNANPAWPPVSTTPPATFNAGPNSPMNPAMTNNAPPTATNVAKPAETNPFWSGNLGSNFAATPTSTTPMNPNPAFAPNVNAPANSFAHAPPGAGMPTRNPLSGADSAAWTGNDFAGAAGSTNAFGNTDHGVQPAGFNDFAQPNGAVNPGPGTMNDASRMAAQMAMATGPGGLLPVVTPGRGAVSMPQNNTSNGVKWAYGETSGTPNRNVENAVWSQQPGADRAVPASNTNGMSLAPAQPWGDFQSPAPAGINWNESANNTGATPPPWSSNPPAGNGNTNASVPAWPGNGNNAAPPSGASSPDAYRWNDFPANGNGRSNDAMMNNTPDGGSTTIPNWPYAPSRP